MAKEKKDQAGHAKIGDKKFGLQTACFHIGKPPVCEMVVQNIG